MPIDLLTVYLYNYFFRQEIHVTDSGGRAVILSFVLNAFVGALTLRFIVGRTKLCLDFTCTYHFIHLFICWVYNGTFPSTFSWWFLNAICATVMCVCSEILCLRIELKEIPVGYTPLDTKADLWNLALPNWFGYNNKNKKQKMNEFIHQIDCREQTW